MPAIEDVYIELQCQQNVSTGAPIEEFAPRPPRADDPENQFMPKLYNANTRTCSVFIPIFPQAQFFLNYHVEPPMDESQFYVFKLFVNGEEFVTWSCGPEHAFCGKTQFGLFDTSKGDGKGLRKRAMYFGAECRIIGDLTVDKDEHRLLEVRVYRGDKKMRAPRDSELYDDRGSNTQITIADAGRVEGGHPKRFYLFGLKDALDKPYATFRFYYRSWEEIDALKLKMGQVDDKDLGLLFCSRSAQVMKDEKRKTLSINSGPAWQRFPGPNNPPIKDGDYTQAFGHGHRPAIQVQQQMNTALRQNPVVTLPHNSNYADARQASFSNQAHPQPYQQPYQQPYHHQYQHHQHQPYHHQHQSYQHQHHQQQQQQQQPYHSSYSAYTHQPGHGTGGFHEPFSHFMPRHTVQPVTPLRESSSGTSQHLPNGLSIPPSMILPPNHPHSSSIPRLSPTKIDGQRPLPRLPGYPMPPPPPTGYL